MFKTLTVGVAMFAAAFAASAQTRLQGAGATFPQPLYSRLVVEYQKVNPGVAIDYQGIGSGGGIKAITEKTVDFAGSDAPLSKKQLEGLGASNVVQVPSCAGGVVPAYNLPGVTQEIKFTGEVLADIYQGKISKWNDAKLVAINEGVALPDLVITPAWRTDGSGTTFVFTNYLATQSESFKENVGMGTAVKWPLGQGGKGNPGVAAIVQQTAGAIGYIESNYAVQSKIPFGLVKNKDGKFVKASPETISLAGAGAITELKGDVLAANLWNQGGEKTYPIAAFTYLIVYKDLSNLKGKEQAQAMVDFLWWATHDGQKLCSELDYAPLTAEVQAKVGETLTHLTCKGEAIKPQTK